MPRSSQKSQINQELNKPEVFGSFTDDVDFSVNNQEATRNVMKYQVRLDDIEARILEDTKSYMKGPNSEYFLGAAIVSFESEEDKIKALSIFERSGWLYRFFGFGPIHTRVELLISDKGSLQ